MVLADTSSMNANTSTSIIITDKNATEVKVHEWAIDASDLRLPPGVVPPSLNTTLGNQQPFLLIYHGSDRFLYRQSMGCIGLVVFND